MPNKCTFCTIVKPTNHLILGTTWYEFCERCGNKATFECWTDEGLIIKTVRELFDAGAQERIERERLGS
jgi:hypothetical protein